VIFVTQSFSQIDGDNVFENLQIVNIELTFSQNNFWDSLTTNYETETYMKADLKLTDETGVYEFTDVGVRLKGNSSYSHPGNKKSFKIDFNKYVSGQNYDGLKKLNLSNCFKDPSMIREKVFFDVCRSAGVPAPRANFANVYFNGTLWGFYTLVEQIDDQFLDWRILDDDGNLFKAGANFGGGPGGGGNAADLKYYGENQEDYEERYELKSNEDENDYTDLIDFVNFIDNSTAVEFEENLKNRVQLDEYMKTIALDNLFSNLDSYTGSARNYYIYHNETTDKWEWIKWDGNEAFGTYTGGPGGGAGNNMTQLALDYSDNDRPLLEKVFASASLNAMYEQEICNISSTYFNPEYMGPKIDAMYNLIKESVYADNGKMYSDANFDANVENNISVGGGPMGGTVYGLKSFVADKSAFINEQLDCSITAVADENLFPILVYPNPFQSTITVDFENPTTGQIEIFNTIGQALITKEIESQSQVILNLHDSLNGIYFLRFTSTDTKTNTLIQKLVKK